MAKYRKSVSEIVASDRWSASDAQRLVEEARRRGVSLAAFSREHGVGAERLYRWERKLRAGRDGGEVPAEFEEVVVAGRVADVEIELRSGRIVRVGAGIDPAALRRLLDAIEGEATC